jgi:putative phosphoesterase
MRLAVLSDVHGNARALRAVLERIKTLSPDAILNLGDCVSGPLWPEETLDLLRGTAMRHVRGNHDRVVGMATTRDIGSTDQFAWETLPAADRAWLAGLPTTVAFDDVLCVHAVPSNDLDYLLEDIVDGNIALSSTPAIAARLGGASAKLVLCGHSHQPRIVRIPDGPVVVNPGSVGWQAYDDDSLPAHVSQTGSPHARFCIVDVKGSEVEATFHAIGYDWDEAARLAASRGYPDWALSLATGYARPA